MDKLVENPDIGQFEQSLTGGASVGQVIVQGIGFLRRQYPIVVLSLACALALGAAYLAATPPLYTAHTRLMLDTSKLRVLPQQQQNYADFQLDSSEVATQIELLKSEAIGLSVVKDLNLTKVREFVEPQPRFLDRLLAVVLSPFGGSEVAVPATQMSEQQQMRRALSHYLGKREVTRVGQTYVLDISYTSLDPERAASVANGIAQAYILDQLDSKYQAQRRAGAWLQQRIVELRQQAMDADRDVLQFKEKNKIITGGGNGQLLSEQQAVDINSQLASARASEAGAKAKLDRIQEVMKDPVPDASVADSLRNEIITKLRGQYLDLDRTYHLWASRYGLTHLAVVNLKTQMTQLQKSMHDELGRIAESYKSDYAIAQARQAALEQSLSQLISGSQLTNRGRLGLSELESRAKVYHSIHDSFLQRYMEMTQQLSFPTTEARDISTATPGGKTSPIVSKVLALASVLGLMFGGGIGFLREKLDHVFRTTRQIETLLMTNCLAVLPIVKRAGVGTSRAEKKRKAAATGAVPVRAIDPNIAGLLRHVVSEPLSSFAEGFRAVKVAADISGTIKENKVIGVSSSLPNEGKSTVACNLAELIAHGGSKCILIDSDLRNPTLSRSLVPRTKVGLLQVLGGKADLNDALHTDNETGMAFLPAVIESHLAHSSEIVGSEAFRRLIESLRRIYDYIIIDLPPLAPVVDVRASIGSVDSYVFVVEWGRTRINMVERQLGSAPELHKRLLGVVLNKANTKLMDRYEDYYGGYYYNRYYARYGYYSQ